MLRELIDRWRSDDRIVPLYERIVAQARQPAFYGGDGVADTPEGRFDLIVVHAILVMRRLQRDGDDGRRVAQKLFDLMFADLDRNLREMGVADLGVPKRIRKMGEAFYGRAAAYGAALELDDRAALADALGRNLFEGRAGEARLSATVDYVIACDRALAALSAEEVAAARIAWPPAPDVMSAGTPAGTPDTTPAGDDARENRDE